MSTHENKAPALSVVMPVYNAEQYLAEAVDSILQQTFTDFELIAIDDGSTDGSGALLETYADRDDRVCLISRENRGLVATLNEGIDRAKAPLVARMDADDICYPERFAIQMAYMAEHPDVLCLGGRFELIDGENRLLTQLTEAPLDDAGIQQKLLSGVCVISHPSVIFRRDAVIDAGYYDPDTMLAEDLDLWLRLGERGKLAIVPEIVLRYRVHENTVSSTRHAEQLRVLRGVCDRACARRGVTVAFVNEGWRPTTRGETYDEMRKRWWWGVTRGDRPLAMAYAWRAIQTMPFRPNAWWLLTRALAMRSKNP